jgi:hypothetical protein
MIVNIPDYTKQNKEKRKTINDFEHLMYGTGQAFSECFRFYNPAQLKIMTTYAMLTPPDR